MLKRFVLLITLFSLVLAACGGSPAEPASAPAEATKEEAKPAEAATPTEAAKAAEPAAAAPAQAAPADGEYAEPCTPANATDAIPDGKLRLVIGTGGTGGVFFPYGGGLARILSEKLENAEATAEETGGSVDNMKLIQVGDADLGMSTVDSAYNAILGEGAYKETGKVPACTVAVLYNSFLHIVALDESGISKVADMKGKRVSVGSAGSSTEGAADRVLEAAGLDPKADITRDNLSAAESVAAMKDKKIDAFFWIGGLPTSAVTDLVNTPNLKVKFLDASEFVEPMRAKYGPVYTAFTLPKAVYAGVEADVPGIGIGNILFVNAKMNPDLVYKLLDTIFANLEEVQKIHPEAAKLTLEGAAQGSSIPFHPGAIKFYSDKGVWPKK